MSVEVASALLIVALAGALGGVGNALLTDNGFIMPRTERLGATSIVRPGVVGNVLVGVIAALVLFGLYGPFADKGFSQTEIQVTFGVFAGAIVSGVGGARVLTGEVDRRLLRAEADVATAQVRSAAGQTDDGGVTIP